ncbi:hypothetical protein D3C78_980000 [compost metagenome]
MAYALGRHALVEDGEVHRMKRRIAQAGEHRSQQQRGVTLGRTGDHAGDDEAGERGEQNGPRAQPVHHKPGQRLAHARDDEEHRQQHAEFGIAVAEIGDQPGEKRRQQQVEEVRGTMGQADEADGARVLAQRHGGLCVGRE